MKKTILLAFLCPLVAAAQTPSITWHKIAGGGGSSSGGNFALVGTVGQHDAGGPMTGGNFSLTGGFWAYIGVNQTPGAPTLYISYTNSIVTVFWQNVPGWSLQQNNNLVNPALWSLNSSWMTSNGTNYLNINNPIGSYFYRLKGQ